MTTTEIAAVTVAIPTIGRIEMLQRCLESIRSGTRHPAEVLLLDQSGKADLAAELGDLSPLTIRVVACDGRGIALNVNNGLREASHEQMLMTHDDCVVATDWVEQMSKAIGDLPGGMVTGRVLPPEGADPKAVPSTIDWNEPWDYTGSLSHGVLYPNNMAVHTSVALGIGGFDERVGFATAAEDLDFSYRWLKAKLPLRYEPQAVVTHVDWRAPEDLTKLYQHYARSAGRFYAKHLITGDRTIAKQALKDIRSGLRAWKRYRSEPFPRWQEQRLELPLFVPVGIAEGLVESARIQWRKRNGAES